MWRASKDTLQWEMWPSVHYSLQLGRHPWCQLGALLHGGSRLLTGITDTGRAGKHDRCSFTVRLPTSASFTDSYTPDASFTGCPPILASYIHTLPVPASQAARQCWLHRFIHSRCQLHRQPASAGFIYSYTPGASFTGSPPVPASYIHTLPVPASQAAHQCRLQIFIHSRCQLHRLLTSAGFIDSYTPGASSTGCPPVVASQIHTLPVPASQAARQWWLHRFIHSWCQLHRQPASAGFIYSYTPGASFTGSPPVPASYIHTLPVPASQAAHQCRLQIFIHSRCQLHRLLTSAGFIDSYTPGASSTGCSPLHRLPTSASFTDSYTPDASFTGCPPILASYIHTLPVPASQAARQWWLHRFIHSWCQLHRQPASAGFIYSYTPGASFTGSPPVPASYIHTLPVPASQAAHQCRLQIFIHSRCQLHRLLTSAGFIDSYTPGASSTGCSPVLASYIHTLLPTSAGFTDSYTPGASFTGCPPVPASQIHTLPVPASQAARQCRLHRFIHSWCQLHRLPASAGFTYSYTPGASVTGCPPVPASQIHTLPVPASQAAHQCRLHRFIHSRCQLHRVPTSAGFRDSYTPGASFTGCPPLHRLPTSASFTDSYTPDASFTGCPPILASYIHTLPVPASQAARQWWLHRFIHSWCQLHRQPASAGFIYSYTPGASFTGSPPVPASYIHTLPVPASQAAHQCRLQIFIHSRCQLHRLLTSAGFIDSYTPGASSTGCSPVLASYIHTLLPTSAGFTDSYTPGASFTGCPPVPASQIHTLPVPASQAARQCRLHRFIHSCCQLHRLPASAGFTYSYTPGASVTGCPPVPASQIHTLPVPASQAAHQCRLHRFIHSRCQLHRVPTSAGFRDSYTPGCPPVVASQIHTLLVPASQAARQCRLHIFIHSRCQLHRQPTSAGFICSYTPGASFTGCPPVPASDIHTLSVPASQAAHQCRLHRFIHSRCQLHRLLASTGFIYSYTPAHQCWLHRFIHSRCQLHRLPASAGFTDSYTPGASFTGCPPVPASQIHTLPVPASQAARQCRLHIFIHSRCQLHRLPTSAGFTDSYTPGASFTGCPPVPASQIHTLPVPASQGAHQCRLQRFIHSRCQLHRLPTSAGFINSYTSPATFTGCPPVLASEIHTLPVPASQAAHQCWLQRFIHSRCHLHRLSTSAGFRDSYTPGASFTGCPPVLASYIHTLPEPAPQAAHQCWLQRFIHSLCHLHRLSTSAGFIDSYTPGASSTGCPPVLASYIHTLPVPASQAADQCWLQIFIHSRCQLHRLPASAGFTDSYTPGASFTGCPPVVASQIHTLLVPASQAARQCRLHIFIHSRCQLHRLPTSAGFIYSYTPGASFTGCPPVLASYIHKLPVPASQAAHQCRLHRFIHSRGQLHRLPTSAGFIDSYTLGASFTGFPPVLASQIHTLPLNRLPANTSFIYSYTPGASFTGCPPVVASQIHTLLVPASQAARQCRLHIFIHSRCQLHRQPTSAGFIYSYTPGASFTGCPPVPASDIHTLPVPASQAAHQCRLHRFIHSRCQLHRLLASTGFIYSYTPAHQCWLHRFIHSRCQLHRLPASAGFTDSYTPGASFTGCPPVPASQIHTLLVPASQAARQCRLHIFIHSRCQRHRLPTSAGFTDSYTPGASFTGCPPVPASQIHTLPVPASQGAHQCRLQRFIHSRCQLHRLPTSAGFINSYTSPATFTGCPPVLASEIHTLPLHRLPTSASFTDSYTPDASFTGCPPILASYIHTLPVPASQAARQWWLHRFIHSWCQLHRQPASAGFIYSYTPGASFTGSPPVPASYIHTLPVPASQAAHQCRLQIFIHSRCQLHRLLTSAGFIDSYTPGASSTGCSPVLASYIHTLLPTSAGFTDSYTPGASFTGCPPVPASQIHTLPVPASQAARQCRLHRFIHSCCQLHRLPASAGFTYSYTPGASVTGCPPVPASQIHTLPVPASQAAHQCRLHRFIHSRCQLHRVPTSAGFRDSYTPGCPPVVASQIHTLLVPASQAARQCRLHIFIHSRCQLHRQPTSAGFICSYTPGASFTGCPPVPASDIHTLSVPASQAAHQCRLHRFIHSRCQLHRLLASTGFIYSYTPAHQCWLHRFIHSRCQLHRLPASAGFTDSYTPGASFTGCPPVPASQIHTLPVPASQAARQCRLHIFIHSRCQLHRLPTSAGFTDSYTPGASFTGCPPVPASQIHTLPVPASQGAHQCRLQRFIHSRCQLHRLPTSAGFINSYTSPATFTGCPPVLASEIHTLPVPSSQAAHQCWLQRFIHSRCHLHRLSTSAGFRDSYTPGASFTGCPPVLASYIHTLPEPAPQAAHQCWLQRFIHSLCHLHRLSTSAGFIDSYTPGASSTGCPPVLASYIHTLPVPASQAADQCWLQIFIHSRCQLHRLPASAGFTDSYTPGASFTGCPPVVASQIHTLLVPASQAARQCRLHIFIHSRCQLHRLPTSAGFIYSYTPGASFTGCPPVLASYIHKLPVPASQAAHQCRLHRFIHSRGQLHRLPTSAGFIDSYTLGASFTGFPPVLASQIHTLPLHRLPTSASFTDSYTPDASLTGCPPILASYIHTLPVPASQAARQWWLHRFIHSWCQLHRQPASAGFIYSYTPGASFTGSPPVPASYIHTLPVPASQAAHQCRLQIFIYSRCQLHRLLTSAGFIDSYTPGASSTGCSPVLASYIHTLLPTSAGFTDSYTPGASFTGCPPVPASQIHTLPVPASQAARQCRLHRFIHSRCQLHRLPASAGFTDSYTPGASFTGCPPVPASQIHTLPVPASQAAHQCRLHRFIHSRCQLHRLPTSAGFTDSYTPGASFTGCPPVPASEIHTLPVPASQAAHQCRLHKFIHFPCHLHRLPTSAGFRDSYTPGASFTGCPPVLASEIHTLPVPPSQAVHQCWLQRFIHSWCQLHRLPTSAGFIYSHTPRASSTGCPPVLASEIHTLPVPPTQAVHQCRLHRFIHSRCQLHRLPTSTSFIYSYTPGASFTGCRPVLASDIHTLPVPASQAAHQCWLHRFIHSRCQLHRLPTSAGFTDSYTPGASFTGCPPVLASDIHTLPVPASQTAHQCWLHRFIHSRCQLHRLPTSTSFIYSYTPGASFTGCPPVLASDIHTLPVPASQAAHQCWLQRFIHSRCQLHRLPTSAGFTDSYTPGCPPVLASQIHTLPVPASQAARQWWLHRFIHSRCQLHRQPASAGFTDSYTPGASFTGSPPVPASQIHTLPVPASQAAHQCRLHIFIHSRCQLHRQPTSAGFIYSYTPGASFTGCPPVPASDIHTLPVPASQAARQYWLHIFIHSCPPVLASQIHTLPVPASQAARQCRLHRFIHSRCQLHRLPASAGFIDSYTPGASFTGCPPVPASHIHTLPVPASQAAHQCRLHRFIHSRCQLHRLPTSAGFTDSYTPGASFTGCPPVPASEIHTLPVPASQAAHQCRLHKFIHFPCHLHRLPTSAGFRDSYTPGASFTGCPPELASEIHTLPVPPSQAVHQCWLQRFIHSWCQLHRLPTSAGFIYSHTPRASSTGCPPVLASEIHTLPVPPTQAVHQCRLHRFIHSRCQLHRLPTSTSFIYSYTPGASFTGCRPVLASDIHTLPVPASQAAHQCWLHRFIHSRCQLHRLPTSAGFTDSYTPGASFTGCPPVLASDIHTLPVPASHAAHQCRLHRFIHSRCQLHRLSTSTSFIYSYTPGASFTGCPPVLASDIHTLPVPASQAAHQCWLQRFIHSRCQLHRLPTSAGFTDSYTPGASFTGCQPVPASDIHTLPVPASQAAHQCRLHRFIHSRCQLHRLPTSTSFIYSYTPSCPPVLASQIQTLPVPASQAARQCRLQRFILSRCQLHRLPASAGFIYSYTPGASFTGCPPVPASDIHTLPVPASQAAHQCRLHIFIHSRCQLHRLPTSAGFRYSYTPGASFTGCPPVPASQIHTLPAPASQGAHQCRLQRFIHSRRQLHRLPTSAGFTDSYTPGASFTGCPPVPASYIHTLPMPASQAAHQCRLRRFIHSRCQLHRLPTSAGFINSYTSPATFTGCPPVLASEIHTLPVPASQAAHQSWLQRFIHSRCHLHRLSTSAGFRDSYTPGASFTGCPPVLASYIHTLPEPAPQAAHQCWLQRFIHSLCHLHRLSTSAGFIDSYTPGASSTGCPPVLASYIHTLPVPASQAADQCWLQIFIHSRCQLHRLPTSAGFTDSYTPGASFTGCPPVPASQIHTLPVPASQAAHQCWLQIFIHSRCQLHRLPTSAGFIDSYTPGASSTGCPPVLASYIHTLPVPASQAAHQCWLQIFIHSRCQLHRLPTSAGFRDSYTPGASFTGCPPVPASQIHTLPVPASQAANQCLLQIFTHSRCQLHRLPTSAGFIDSYTPGASSTGCPPVLASYIHTLPVPASQAAHQCWLQIFRHSRCQLHRLPASAGFTDSDTPGASFTGCPPVPASEIHTLPVPASQAARQCRLHIFIHSRCQLHRLPTSAGFRYSYTPGASFTGCPPVPASYIHTLPVPASQASHQCRLQIFIHSRCQLHRLPTSAGFTDSYTPGASFTGCPPVPASEIHTLPATASQAAHQCRLHRFIHSRRQLHRLPTSAGFIYSYTPDASFTGCPPVPASDIHTLPVPASQAAHQCRLHRFIHSRCQLHRLPTSTNFIYSYTPGASFTGCPPVLASDIHTLPVPASQATRQCSLHRFIHSRCQLHRLPASAGFRDSLSLCQLHRLPASAGFIYSYTPGASFTGCPPVPASYIHTLPVPASQAAHQCRIQIFIHSRCQLHRLPTSAGLIYSYTPCASFTGCPPVPASEIHTLPVPASQAAHQCRLHRFINSRCQLHRLPTSAGFIYSYTPGVSFTGCPPVPASHIHTLLVPASQAAHQCRLHRFIHSRCQLHRLPTSTSFIYSYTPGASFTGCPPVLASDIHTLPVPASQAARQCWLHRFIHSRCQLHRLPASAGFKDSYTPGASFTGCPPVPASDIHTLPVPASQAAHQCRLQIFIHSRCQLHRLPTSAGFRYSYTPGASFTGCPPVPASDIHTLPVPASQAAHQCRLQIFIHSRCQLHRLPTSAGFTDSYTPGASFTGCPPVPASQIHTLPVPASQPAHQCWLHKFIHFPCHLHRLPTSAGFRDSYTLGASFTGCPPVLAS
ncbi:hypothetical protein NDU88_000501 [Pleurodeles waltl]|uniref:Uncharacterized protein n=1 Tax=Pleurodeles waltl TaxID=8319 RepID=A0AAV7Q484_PLEWA|nr:hypothetical protein NDU88_000501 [Pleurodeles waltl]